MDYRRFAVPSQVLFLSSDGASSRTLNLLINFPLLSEHLERSGLPLSDSLIKITYLQVNEKGETSVSARFSPTALSGLRIQAGWYNLVSQAYGPVAQW